MGFTPKGPSMSYLFFAVGLYLAGKCCWEVYLYFFDRSMFERMRAKIEDGELGDHTGEYGGDQKGEYGPEYGREYGREYGSKGEDIKSPFYLFIAYPFLIGAFFMIGYLIRII